MFYDQHYHGAIYKRILYHFSLTLQYFAHCTVVVVIIIVVIALVSVQRCGVCRLFGSHEHGVLHTDSSLRKQRQLRPRHGDVEKGTFNTAVPLLICTTTY
jgi:hypothetical protein